MIVDAFSQLPPAVGVTIVVVGAIALGWAIFRAQALSAWRAAAEGYKAQVEEMTPRLTRAEQLAVSMQAQIAELERRPDHSQVLAAIAKLSADVSQALSFREPLRGAARDDP